MINKEVAYYNMSLKFQTLDDDVPCLYIRTLQNMLNQKDLDINALCNMLYTITDNDIKELTILIDEFNGLVNQLKASSFLSILPICKKIQNNGKKLLEIYKRIMQIRCIQIGRTSNTIDAQYQLLGNTINEHKRKLCEISESARDIYSKINEKSYDGYNKLDIQNKSKINNTLTKLQRLFKNNNVISESNEVILSENSFSSFLKFLVTTKAGYFALFMVFLFSKTRPLYVIGAPINWGLDKFGYGGQFKIVNALEDGSVSDFTSWFSGLWYSHYRGDTFTNDMQNINNSISGQPFDPNADYARPYIPLLQRYNIDISKIQYKSQFGNALDQLAKTGVISQADADAQKEELQDYGFHWVLGLGFIVIVIILIVMFIYWFICKYRAMKDEEQLEDLNNKLDQINKDSAQGKSFEAHNNITDDGQNSTNDTLQKAEEFTGFSNTASYKPAGIESKTNDIHGIF